MEVEWRKVPFDFDYSVSSAGELRNDSTGRILKPRKCRRYNSFAMQNSGRRMDISAHTLIAMVFIGERPPGYDVCHKNGIPSDNRVENLYYGTKSQNQLDSVRHGTHRGSRKTHCPRNHEYDRVDVNGARRCSTCLKIANDKSNLKKKMRKQSERRSKENA
ncbi:hypothetical protein GMA3_25 [Gordonia phage GMA3]|uniref:Uncharacterized protein n=1 Tax=Gordonia phage GMA3 TaxID=1647284 RepID=A0A0K0NKY0_9CAUD|nr:HNH endonuclease [Gordonia phage GMA3]AKL88202.1 hypothetical protein GMA3_25 [Gordonia phage GMA3]